MEVKLKNPEGLVKSPTPQYNKKHVTLSGQVENAKKHKRKKIRERKEKKDGKLQKAKWKTKENKTGLKLPSQNHPYQPLPPPTHESPRLPTNKMRGHKNM